MTFAALNPPSTFSPPMGVVRSPWLVLSDGDGSSGIASMAGGRDVTALSAAARTAMADDLKSPGTGSSEVAGAGGAPGVGRDLVDEQRDPHPRHSWMVSLTAVGMATAAAATATGAGARALAGVPAPTSVVQVRQGNGQKSRDQELLARAIAAEARGESFHAQVAVGATVLNYCRATGRSVKKVVQSTYLSSYHDGNRKFYTMATSKIPKWEQAWRAAGDAMNGEAPFGKDYLHFIDDSIRPPSWTNAKSAVRIGSLIFLKPSK